VASLKTSSTKTKPAGLGLMEEVSANLFPLVLQALNKMALSVTLSVKLVIMVSVPSVGKVAPVASLTLVLTVSSLHLTEEELVIPASLHAKRNTLKVAKRTVFSTTLTVLLTSTTSAAVFALLIALLDGLISVSHAKKVAMVEVLVLLLFVLLINKKMLDSVTSNVIVDTLVSDLSAGDLVLLA